jgi:hypothetical protein
VTPQPSQSNPQVHVNIDKHDLKYIAVRIPYLTRISLNIELDTKFVASLSMSVLEYQEFQTFITKVKVILSWDICLLIG